MPSFTSHVSNLQSLGPVVEQLQIAVGSAVESALRRVGTRIPDPVLTTAMIDTGATVSVIRQGIPSQLGLNPVGVTHIHAPSSHQCRLL